MKKLSKGITSIVFIGLIGVVAFSLANTKKELKPTIQNKRLAVFIKGEDGYEQASSIPQTGYTLNTEKSVCNNGVTPTWKNKTLILNNLTQENTNCYLYFDKKETYTSEDTLETLGITNVNTGTPNFSQVATTDEGIFKAEDGMYGGTSYYWRGAVTNNYITFAGFCWRIVRINGDGSIRMIYDGSTCHANGTSTAESIAKTSIAYNTSYNNSSYVGWTYIASAQRPTPSTGGTSSNAKTQLEDWYNGAITGTNAEKLADGIYCNDRTVGSGTWSSTGSTFYYSGYTRLNTNKLPNLGCDASDRYTLKVGLITADEVSMAGGVWGTNNTSYYLYNNQNYWTMSPYRWNSSNSCAYVFYMYVGSLNANIHVGGTNGLRPVINLRSDINISSGDGTLDNPYVVEGA